MADLNLADLPLGGILPTDHWHVETSDETCSRCRERIGEEEVPLLLWDRADTRRMLSYCERCAFDPDSDRCVACGCSDLNPCDVPCGWYVGGLCSECAPRAEDPEIVARLSARASREVPT